MQNVLVIEISTAEMAAIKAGKTNEIYRTATDDWFAKLYETEAPFGIANLDKPIPYKFVELKSGTESLKVSFAGFEVEEFLNKAEDSDERFGFVLQITQ